ncbi:MAG: hypothetical protein K2X50_02505 [Gammaproteobacteria bacterium]|nr:hypothetical protein [Gammaproteobacteria bacterium]
MKKDRLIKYGVYCADFRWHHGELTLLEIGDGFYSEFYGDYSDNKFSLRDLIYQYVDNDLQSYDCPRVYVSAMPQTLTERRGLKRSNMVDDDILGPSLGPNKHYSAFEFSSWNASTIALNVVKLESCRFAKHEYSDQETIERLRGKPENNPSIILQASDSFIACKGDKFWLSQFQKQVSTKALPQDFIIDLGNHNPATLNINLEKFYVIKPTDASGGDGVLVVRGIHLIALLSAIKHKNHNEIPEALLTDQKFIAGFDYLIKRISNLLVVQEYAPADLITVENEEFCPTGRLLFTVKQFDDNRVVVEVIPNSIYFKLPRSPYISCSTTGCISDVYYQREARAKAKKISTLIHESVQQHIAKSFLTKATPLMTEILTTPLCSMLEGILQSPTPNESKEYSLTSLGHYPIYELTTANLKNLERLVHNNNISQAIWHSFLIQQLKFSVLSCYNERPNAELADFVMTKIYHGQFSEPHLKEILHYIETADSTPNRDRNRFKNLIQQFCEENLRYLTPTISI